MNNVEINRRRSDAISRGVGAMTQVYVERAENAEVWDVEGTRYIDFATRIAVVNTGHRHPKVMAAVEKQLSAFTHTCHQVLPYENYVALAERLNAVVPGGFDKKTVFVTTGAEAVENSIKIARAASGMRRRSITACVQILCKGLHKIRQFHRLSGSTDPFEVIYCHSILATHPVYLPPDQEIGFRLGDVPVEPLKQDGY